MKRYQHGFVVASALVATLSISVLIYFTFAMGVASKEASRLEDKKREWVSETRVKLENWYKRNAQAIESNPAAITQSAVLSGAGITLEYGARYMSTVRLNASGIGYHNIAIWLPLDGVTGAGLNASTGEFSPGTLASGDTAPTKYAMVNGRTIQTRNYLATIKKMRRNAAKLEGYYRARMLSDPDSDSAINYYRAGDCTNPVNGELPCLDYYTPLAASGIVDMVGLSAEDNINAWGGAIEVSTKDGIPPGLIGISIRTVTPWISLIQVMGVRP